MRQNICEVVTSGKIWVVVVENFIRGREAVVGNSVSNVEVVNRTACGCRANVSNPSLSCPMEGKDGGRRRIGEKWTWLSTVIINSELVLRRLDGALVDTAVTRIIVWSRS